MTTPSSRPPPEMDDHAPHFSRVLRFGSLVGVALVAAFVASAPAALRTWDTSGAWLALAALDFVPIFFAVIVFRHARVGLRVFAGPDAAERSLAIAVWLVLAVVSFSLLGAVLRATTHHHPLAGVTFAIVACAGALLLMPMSRRIVEIALGWLRRGARARLALAFVILGTIVGLLVLRLLHALPVESALSPTASEIVVDAFAFALVAFLASNPAIQDTRKPARYFSPQKTLALIGPPAAVVLLATSLLRLESSSALTAAIVDRDPVFSPLVELVTRR
ncbi:MAG: hypothetical protein ACRELY_26785 [Polyangiaceae bacterium]